MSGPVDPSDPRVRQLAYNMYRDMLGACHGRSSEMVNRAPQGKQVIQDRGVQQQIVSMAQQKTAAALGDDSPAPSYNNGTSATAANNGTQAISLANGVSKGTPRTNGFSRTNGVPVPFSKGSSHPVNGTVDRVDGAECNGTNGTSDFVMHRAGIPPPPPPPAPGAFNGGSRGPQQAQLREAPAVIQNAMATKDKKPFSYLPAGGIDMSEIRGHPIQQKIAVNPSAEPPRSQNPPYTFTVQTVAPSCRPSAAQGHMVPVAQSSPPANSAKVTTSGGVASKQNSVGSAWEQNLARQRSAAAPSAPFGEKMALASTGKRPSPPSSVTDGAPTATVAMAANPPWRVTRKQSFPNPASSSQPAVTQHDKQGSIASSVNNVAPASVQARGQLYIPPVSKPEAIAEALASPPVHTRNTPPSWQQTNPTKAKAEPPAVSKMDDANMPQWRLARQVQKQASQPSGMGREINESARQQQQQHETPAQRQQSLSSERTIPVQLVTGPDGQPHVSIGGRLIPVTADGVQLPMGLIMPEVDKGRLIQEVTRRQNILPPAPTPSAARPRDVPYNVPKDSAGDPIPTMRSLQLSEEDRRLVSAFREQEDTDLTDSAPEDKTLYKGSHIPSRLFRTLERTVSGGVAPPSRIGGPGQGRAVIVNMKPGKPGGNGVAARQEEAPQQKRNPSRSFRVLQQMTAEEQES